MNDRKNIKINIPSANLELKKTFLETLSCEEEIFALAEGRVYTLGFPTEREEETLEYRGIRFELRESESVRKLEEIFFEDNKKNIERFKSDIVDKLAQEERSLNNNLRTGEIVKGEESKREELLNEIQRYSRMTIKSPERRVVRESIDFSSIGEIDFGGRPVFNEALEKMPGLGKASVLVGLFGNLYLTNPKKLRISLENISEFEDIGGYETLNGVYVDSIRERIKERTAQAARQIIDKLSEKKEEVESMRNFSAADSKVKLRRISGDQCIVYREIPEFIIKRGAEYGLFSEAKIAAKLEFRKDEVKINVPGFVLDDNSYYHLFSMGQIEHGTKICHGSNPDWKSKGINQSWQKISDSSRRNLAYQTHAVMDKLEQVLTMGCRRDFVPGSAFYGFNRCSIEPSRAMTLNRRGVKIYDNTE